MSETLALRLYRLATRALPLVAPALLRARLAKGKEDAARLAERMGEASRPRPSGPLAWLHGASVGESLSLMPLIEKLRARGLNVLVTTGTLTSAQVMGDRLPAGAFHQFVPLDCPRYMRTFLAHWRPDILLIAESELWPNMLHEAAHAGVPAFLINARMSGRSAQRWSKAPGTIAHLLSHFSAVLAQSPHDADRYRQLGATHVMDAGNLKYDVAALPHDPLQLAEFSARIGQRPVWLAASTHDGEERIAMFAHRALLQFWPDLVTLVAPRHPHRGVAICEEARSFGLNAALRSRGETVSDGASIYIADTIGEMGLFYRLASAVLVGNSLVSRGGHNPIEVAKLGAPVLHGPHVQNFLDVYAALDAAGGAFMVDSPDDLARTLARLLRDTALVRSSARAASEVVAKFGGASARIMNVIEPALPPTQNTQS